MSVHSVLDDCGFGDNSRRALGKGWKSNASRKLARESLRNEWRRQVYLQWRVYRATRGDWLRICANVRSASKVQYAIVVEIDPIVSQVHLHHQA